MSTEKTKRAINDVKAALKQLKKIGVPTVQQYDARKSLTKSQKETIRRNFRKYEQIATAPAEYVKKDATKLSASEKKNLQEKGYQIVGKKLFVEKQGFDSVHMRKKEFKTDDGKKISTVKIIRKKEGFRPETEYVMPKHQFSDLQEYLLKQYERGNFKQGDYMGVKIGRGGRARRVMMLSVDSIYRYLIDDFEPKDSGTDKDKLIMDTTLIKISTKENLPVFERDRKEKNRVSRQRSRSRKAVSNKLVGKVSRTKK
jgi:hypothetical protein